jgi:protein-S-isoprenylcysteine O-methyltransferase Ste14
MNMLSSILGLIIFLVSAITGGILIFAPGSIRLERPECGWIGWTFNILSLLFFIILIPLCGVLMIWNLHEPYFICIPQTSSGLQLVLGIIGTLVFLAGSLLLLWSRLSLRRSFRLGGVKPGQNDYLTMHGPYKYMRHPMYLSALLVLFGLALLISSILMGGMFLIMFLLIWKLIPIEERQLEHAYPLAYAEYCRRVTGSLLPGIRHQS